MPTAMIVCCYGIYDRDLRSISEINGYREYLKGVAALIAQRHPKYVVLCGGRIHPGTTESEAASVLPVLEELRQGQYNVRFLLEEESQRTPQKLSFGLDQLIKQGQGLHKLIVVTDYVRRWKVNVLMWRLTSVPWEVFGFHRQDTHPDNHPHMQLIETLKCLFLPRKRVFS